MLLFAHGIVGRADLPIPETLFGAAAAAVLVVSFVALALGWSEPKLAAHQGKVLFAFPRALEVLCGAIGIFVFLVTVYAGHRRHRASRARTSPRRRSTCCSGSASRVASLIFGDIWQFFSPWRAIGRAVGWIASRISDELPEPIEYPPRLGRIPAAAVLFGFAICELCWARATMPGPLAVIALLYLIVMLLGQSLYGVDPWTRNADGFGVLWSLIGSLSPLGVREDGKFVGPHPRHRRRRAGAGRGDVGGR